MERNLQIQGVVTGVRSFGESHRCVNILSSQNGLISAVIYGGRKGKKTSLAPLFSSGTFHVYHNPVRDEYSLVDSELSFIPDRLLSDLHTNARASYFCEVTTRISTDSPQEVFTLVRTALSELEKDPDNGRKILIDFTWSLLKTSGVGCELSSCPSCDRSLGDEETIYFSTSMLTPVCRNCADSDFVTLTPGARRYLIHTYPMTFSQALPVRLFETAQMRLTTIMLNWISQFCQYPLKTVRSGLL